MKGRFGLGCLGLVVGAGLGVLLGSLAMYALASLVTKSRETQAYLTLLIVPGVALVGAITVAATLAAIPAQRSPALLATAGVGWTVLLVVLAFGVSWHHRARPAQMRVRNETAMPFRNLFIGGDFRRSTRLGELLPGATTAPVPVDLAQPGSFDALEGQAGSGYVRHRLTPEESAALGDGDYTWVVRGTDGALTYELVPQTRP